VNVWAPANANSNSNLPVKVWIYGGGQQGGGIQNPIFNGCSLAAHDTLLVSINYRLGPLGYLTVDDAGIGGNFAIQDLILGLEWVQSHIAAFGGDPVSFGLLYPELEADANYISTEKGCLVWRIRRSDERLYSQYPAAGPITLQCCHLGIRCWSTTRCSGSCEHFRDIICKQAQLYHKCEQRYESLVSE
jgi:hypothetical protein